MVYVTGYGLRRYQSDGMDPCSYDPGMRRRRINKPPNLAGRKSHNYVIPLTLRTLSNASYMGLYPHQLGVISCPKAASYRCSKVASEPERFVGEPGSWGWRLNPLPHCFLFLTSFLFACRWMVLSRAKPESY